MHARCQGPKVGSAASSRCSVCSMSLHGAGQAADVASVTRLNQGCGPGRWAGHLQGMQFPAPRIDRPWVSSIKSKIAAHTRPRRQTTELIHRQSATMGSNGNANPAAQLLSGSCNRLRQMAAAEESRELKRTRKQCWLFRGAKGSGQGAAGCWLPASPPLLQSHGRWHQLLLPAAELSVYLGSSYATNGLSLKPLRSGTTYSGSFSFVTK